MGQTSDLGDMTSRDFGLYTLAGERLTEHPRKQNHPSARDTHFDRTQHKRWLKEWKFD